MILVRSIIENEIYNSKFRCHNIELLLYNLPSIAHSQLLYGGNLKTSAWMIFQPTSSWSEAEKRLNCIALIQWLWFSVGWRMNEAENLSLILRWQNGIWCAIGHQVTWFAIHLCLSHPADQSNLSVVLLSISLEITMHNFSLMIWLVQGYCFFFSFLRYQCSSDLWL